MIRKSLKGPAAVTEDKEDDEFWSSITQSLILYLQKRGQMPFGLITAAVRATVSVTG